MTTRPSAAARSASSEQASCEQADKRAHGRVERYHRTAQGIWWCLVLATCTDYKLELPTGHRVLKWALRHASWLHDWLQVHREDGLTSYHRHQGRDYAGQLVPIAETVLWREPGPHKLKLREKLANML